MKTIVAIGGGDRKSTLPIDKEIVRLARNTARTKKPHVVFIPTASSDHEGYIKIMKRRYEGLGCTFEPLLLLENPPTAPQRTAMIKKADIIYVGGGNTLKMMRRWRHLSVDKLLKQAYKRGAIMCGVSAGSICWYESGHSDSMSSYNPKKWEYINVKGLGLLQGVHCPHYDGHTGNKYRKKDFQKMMKNLPTGTMGIAIDNHCAVVYLNEKPRVLSTKKGANAYTIRIKDGKILEEIL